MLQLRILGSIHTPFMQARAESGAEYEKPARTREEEEQLLRDFVATAPACSVPVESKIVDTTTGFAACDFTQSIGAELLVMPAPEHVEGAVPSMMDWALQVIPCSLWIVRETNPFGLPARDATFRMRCAGPLEDSGTAREQAH